MTDPRPDRIERRTRGAVILLYHRVARLGSDPHAIAVKPSRFREHLELLNADYHPMELAELLRVLAAGRVPDRAAAVTFDDGYADNLENAKPLLARAGVPATVFVSTGNLDADREFWWDELERIFLAPGALPRRLLTWIGGRPFHADLASAAEYGEAQAREHVAWSARANPPPTARHATFVRLFGRLQRLDRRARATAMERLHSWAGVEPVMRATHRPLRPTQIAELEADGLIDIGAHTVSHPRLSKLSARQRSAEILDSRRRLEQILARPVLDFAYPFGDAKRTTSAVDQAGMRSACMTRAGVIQTGADPLRLPRVYVGDWPPEALERTLARTFASGPTAGALA